MISVEAIEYSPDSAKFEFTFRLGDEGEINYLYNWSLPLELLKPRILIYMQEYYRGMSHENVRAVGAHSWTKIETNTPENKALSWVQAKVTYEVTGSNDLTPFPFGSSTYYFY